jgi:hypothetical protein
MARFRPESVAASSWNSLEHMLLEQLLKCGYTVVCLTSISMQPVTSDGGATYGFHGRAL